MKPVKIHIDALPQWIVDWTNGSEDILPFIKAHIECTSLLANGNQTMQFDDLARIAAATKTTAEYVLDLYHTLAKCSISPIGLGELVEGIEPIHRENVAVLLVETNKSGFSQGFVADLELSLMNVAEHTSSGISSARQLYPAPLVSLISRDTHFRAAECHAVDAVLTLLGRDKWSASRAVRWKLRRRDGKPLHHIAGDSAGAALAIALYNLLASDNNVSVAKSSPGEQRLDLTGIAVSAKVSGSGALQAVSGEFEKLVAAARDRSFTRAMVLMAEEQLVHSGDLNCFRNLPWFLHSGPFSLIKAPSLTDARRRIWIYHNTKGGRPWPDHGLDCPAPPRAQPLQLLKPRTDSVDLGMGWGLDRGGYVLLIEGTDDDDIYEGLANVERALLDVIQECSPALTLPTRWWLRIELPSPSPVSRFPNGPQTLQDVLLSADASVQSEYLRDKYREESRLDENDVLGLFLDVRTSAAPAEQIVSWLHQLTTCVCKDGEAAIVVHLRGGGSSDSCHYFDAVRVWNAGAGYPLHVTRYIGVPHARPTKEQLTQAGQAMSLISHADVPTRIQAIVEKLRGIAFAERGRLRAYVCATGMSDDELVRAVGLHYASESEDLLDEWIDGIVCARRGITPRLLGLVPARVPMVDQVVLGLLRCYFRTQLATRDVASALLQQLGPLIADRRLANLVEWSHSGGELSIRDDRTRWLAYRAGIEQAVPSGLLQRRSLSDYDFWAGLHRVPATTSVIRELLSASLPQRAAFGLLSRNEAATLSNAGNEFLIHELETARGERPLSVFSNTKERRRDDC